MSVALRHDWWVSPEEYLQGEILADTKHEYVGGVVYAVAGAKNRHNRIAGNILIELGSQLRTHRCQPFNSDTKVRIRNGSDVRFYYPDAMVVCDENDPDEVFQDHPVALFEALSESTTRTNREEKLRAYQTIKTLRIYAILESERIGVTCYERAGEEEEWTVRSLKERGQNLPLAAVGRALPLDALYARTGL